MTTTTPLRDLSMAELALQYPNAIAVFNKYHLDYCCGGKDSLAKACGETNLGLEQIEKEIVLTTTPARGTMTFEQWSPSLLADYIQEQHHGYVRAAIPLIEQLLAKVVHKHGASHRELEEIHACFLSLSQELTSHMGKEEQVLFPAIKQRAGWASTALELPISIMVDEHQKAGDLIKQIRRFTHNYQPPANACTSFQALYLKLEEFDNDLMQHVHLENNILFPKVLAGTV
ncbi:MAG: iron-sulfur cluster repair di-iron protein [Cyclobacteriaceae bacterium]